MTGLVEFLIAWLLCTVAFMTSPGSPPPDYLRAGAAGALVAIAISFVGAHLLPH
jgi:hypothetical protein